MSNNSTSIRNQELQDIISTSPEWVRSSTLMERHFSKQRPESPTWANTSSPPEQSLLRNVSFENANNLNNTTSTLSATTTTAHLKTIRSEVSLNELEVDVFITLPEGHLFRPVLHPKEEVRKEALQQVINVLKTYVSQFTAAKSKLTSLRKSKKIPKCGATTSSSVPGCGEEEYYLMKQRLSDDFDNGHEDEEEQIIKEDKQEAFQMLLDYKSLIVRFAYDSPFQDMRDAFQAFIAFMFEQDVFEPVSGDDDLEDEDDKRQRAELVVPKTSSEYINSPSSFVPFDTFEKIDTEEIRSKTLFREFFLEDGIVGHVARVLSAHPSYMQVYYQTYAYLIKANGPLPLAWRHFIAILAASRHNCEYIVRRQQVEFLMTGGDPEWLKGVDYIPQKLQNLLQFNALLAHQPWLLNKTHVEALVKGNDAWSVAELVHAVTLMSHFHALSSLVFGCGILADDFEVTNLLMMNNNNNNSSNSSNNSNNSNHHFMHNNFATSILPSATDSSNVIATPITPITPSSALLNSNISEETSQKIVQSLQEEQDEEEEIDEKERQKMFEEAGATTLTINTSGNRGSFSGSSGVSPMGSQATTPTSLPRSTSSTSLSLGHLSSSPSSKVIDVMKSSTQSFDYLTYKDFDVRSKDYKIFVVQEYNWQDHAFSLLNRFYGEAADLLDTEFEHIYNMTDRQFHQVQNIDTGRFREAVWYYVYRLYGMLHDDFNYNNINKLLTIPLKNYIKKTACHPERVTLEDFQTIGLALRPKEKIHVNLLAAQARKQVELVYALHSIYKYMQN